MSNDKQDYEHNPMDISEFLETSNENEENLPSTVETRESEGLDKDVQTDYEEARKTYYELIQKGQDALDSLLEIAASSEHPRAFEVAAQMIKTISETNDRIVDLQHQMRKIQDLDIEKQDQQNGGATVNNNTVFVGSMNEFQQFLKKMKKQKEVTQENE